MTEKENIIERLEEIILEITKFDYSKLSGVRKKAA